MRYGRPYRRSNRIYYVMAVREDGTRTMRSTGTRLYREAVEVVEGWRRRAARESGTEPQELGEAVEAWLEAKRPRMSRGYQVVYGGMGRRWVRHFGPHALLDDLTADRLAGYLRIRRAMGRSAVTVNGERAALRSFFAYACARGWVRGNPAALVSRHQEPARAVRALTPTEESRLLGSAQRAGNGAYSAILCLLLTGLRRGAVETVTWSDVDLDAGVWQIPAAKMKSRQPFLGRPVPDEILELLRSRRGRSRDRIFGRLGKRVWLAVVASAGLPWLRVHDLRRTFLTRLRRAGVALEVAMWLSDHRDLRTVLECYREVDAEEGVKALRSARASRRGGEPSGGRPAPEPSGPAGP